MPEIGPKGDAEPSKWMRTSNKAFTTVLLQPWRVLVTPELFSTCALNMRSPRE
jgi:hypothetical protein